MILIRQQPPVPIVICTAAEQEVNWSSLKSDKILNREEDVVGSMVEQAQNFPNVYLLAMEVNDFNRDHNVFQDLTNHF